MPKPIRAQARPTPGIDLDHALGILSSPAERISALLHLGFKYDEIAAALGASGVSVRGWAEGKPLTTSNEDCLDEFRAIALLLYQELGPTAVRSFFRSRPAPGGKRPLDYIRTDPNAVGAAAMAEIRRREDLAASGKPVGNSEELEGVARGIIEKAHDRDVNPVNLPDEPALPKMAEEAHVDMSLERRKWETGAPVA